MSEKPVVIIGGGPAGLVAAKAAKDGGAKRVLVIDREKHTGGILNQCIHAGFGLTQFKEELTGPQYAARVGDAAADAGVEFMTDTTVLRLSPDKTVTVVNEKGVSHIEAASVVLATGCRERPRGAIHIPGERPAGVYTAGLAQKLVNVAGVLVGKRVVILGSGDIGLIMARRLTLAGAKVLAVVEVMKTAGGLARNIAQCLNDFDIPLYLSHTITDIKGTKRVESVTVAKVDDKMRPVENSEFTLDCDTVLLSVGLIPENEIAQSAGVELNPATNGLSVDENLMTTADGVFGCGNALHVHDLVDNLAIESALAGKNAALYAAGERFAPCPIPVSTDANFGYAVPARVSGEKPVRVQFRVRRAFKNATVEAGDFSRKFAFLQPNHMESATIPADKISCSGVKLCLNAN